MLGMSSLGTAQADWPIYFQVEVHPHYPTSVPDYRPACPPPSYGYAPSYAGAAAQADYQPHLLTVYRQGYWAGVHARRCGWARDSHGAWLASGLAWESYFQEGYADGYDGHGMRH
jgi:hypothetical protein